MRSDSQGGAAARLALFAGFAAVSDGAPYAVARRRGAFLLQRRSLVGLLDAATCRKSPLSCSSSCYAALFCLESLMPLKSYGVSKDPICREGVAFRTRVGISSRKGVPNFKSSRVRGAWLITVQQRHHFFWQPNHAARVACSYVCWCETHSVNSRGRLIEILPENQAGTCQPGSQTAANALPPP